MGSVKRTGTIQPWRDADGKQRYRARIRLGDGSRPWLPVPENYSEARAREFAAAMQEQEDAKGKLLAAKKEREARAARPAAGTAGEMCDDWYERFMTYRRNEVGSVDDDKWRWMKWASPLLQKAMREVTADDIENIRDDLTNAVLAYEAAGNVKGEGRLAPKTAQNIWAAITTPFKYASTRKGPRELRVREDLGNPCLGIPPPRDGESKKRRWNRPAEISAVLACEDIPLRWREAIAIGSYLHLRPGELHELRVKDIDIEIGEVEIRRAYDERSKEVTTPKTDEGIRHVTIPAALIPLLERISKERGRDDLVAPVIGQTPEKSRAGLFRGFLHMAGVDRAELFEETETHLSIDFRSLRDSGITWRFLAGERAEVVQREAGHELFQTTLGYAKEVENRKGRFGEPFPALPANLIRPTRSIESVYQVTKPLKNRGIVVGEAGFEPATTSTQSLCTTGLCDSPETHSF